MLYGRSYGGRQMLVGEGVAGETLPSPINEQGDISMDTMDTMVHIGAQVADRFPVFDTAGVASSWTGVCDVTPDWNPCSAACRRCRAWSWVMVSRATASSCPRQWVTSWPRKGWACPPMSVSRPMRWSAFAPDDTCSPASTAPAPCPELGAPALLRQSSDSPAGPAAGRSAALPAATRPGFRSPTSRAPRRPAIRSPHNPWHMSSRHGGSNRRR